jgi:hypothetical protein
MRTAARVRLVGQPNPRIQRPRDAYLETGGCAQISIVPDIA